MGDLALAEEESGLVEVLADQRVGIVDLHAGIGPGLIGEDAVAVHRRQDL